MLREIYALSLILSLSLSFSVNHLSNFQYYFEINMISIDAINFQERLQQGPDRFDGAANSYQTFLKKFAAFLSAPICHKNEPMIAANFFTDDNMVKFFIALLGVDMEDKPHALKAARATMKYGLEMNKLPILAENSHIYPDTWRVITVK
jgi:hypothetical protein